MPNLISATLTPAETDSIINQLTALREQLPFLKSLSESEKSGMVRISHKSIGFIQAALRLAQQNSDFLPAKFEVAEMEKDVNLMVQLETLRIALSKLSQEIEETLIAASSDAYSAALLIYHYAKQGKIATEGLDNLVDELGKRFARKSKPNPPTA